MTFREFIEANKDEITALRIIYDQKYKDRPMAIERLKQLYSKLQEKGVTVERLWECYAIKRPEKVKRGTVAQLTDLISIIRFEMGYIDFVNGFDEQLELESRDPKCYMDLHKAVRNNLDYGSFFLSAYNMFGCIGYLVNPQGAYAKSLYEYLDSHHWDIDKLSDGEYIDKSKSFVADYRGRAAHPNTMDANDADYSKEKTAKIVRRILQSKNLDIASN